MADDAKADGHANVLTWLGIIVALGGPTLAVFAKRAGYFGHDAVDGDILNWLAMWGAALLAMLILVVGERQPLAAIGLGRLKPSSILFGLLFGVVVILLFPAANAILKALQIP